MNIFQIDDAILSCVDADTGEVIDQTMLDLLQVQREYKIENVALWIKELRAEADAISKEVKNLNERKRVAENKVKSLTQYLEYALEGEPFKTAKVTISYRKSELVEITDMKALDKRFLKYKDPEPDKKAIKEAIKDDQIVEGAKLVVNQNMQIK